MALSGTKRAAAARSLLTSSELKTLQMRILRCLYERTSAKTHNLRLDRQQMTVGQVWPVGRSSELMHDHCCFQLTG
jgi:hypothetical protein